MGRSYMIQRRIQQLYRAFCFVFVRNPQSKVASRPTRIGGAARLAPNAARWPAIGTPASVHVPTCSVQHKTFGGCDHSQSWRADSAEQLERHSLARDASSQSPSHIVGSIDAATSKTPASCPIPHASRGCHFFMLCHPLGTQYPLSVHTVRIKF